MTAIVRTVTGDVDPADVGITLFHEHISSDMSPWLRDDNFALTDASLAAEELTAARGEGLDCIVDATTSDVGRSGADLRHAARHSGVRVVAAGGLYRQLTFPTDLGDEDALVETFIAEVTRGVDDSGVRAGVLGELGASDDGMTEDERRVFRAAAHAHVATGVPIITHTAAGVEAMAQLSLLCGLGVDAAAVAIGHLDCVDDTGLHRAVADAGAYVGIDRVGLDDHQPDDARVRFVLALVEAGHTERVLLSADTARRSRLRRWGGSGYAGVLVDFVPRLAAAGLDDTTLRTILVDNPRRFLAFAPRMS